MLYEGRRKRRGREGEGEIRKEEGRERGEEGERMRGRKREGEGIVGCFKMLPT